MKDPREMQLQITRLVEDEEGFRGPITVLEWEEDFDLWEVTFVEVDDVVMRHYVIAPHEEDAFDWVSNYRSAVCATMGTDVVSVTMRLVDRFQSLCLPPRTTFFTGPPEDWPPTRETEDNETQ